MENKTRLSKEELSKFIDEHSAEELTERTVALENNIKALIQSIDNLIEDEKEIAAMTGMSVFVFTASLLPNSEEEVGDRDSIKPKSMAGFIPGFIHEDFKNLLIKEIVNRL